VNPFPGSVLPSRRTVTESLVAVRFGVDADVAAIIIADIDWSFFGTNAVLWTWTKVMTPGIKRLV
jgi:hypothetical protein